MYLLSSLLELAKVNRPFNHGIFYSPKKGPIIEVKKISDIHIIVVEKTLLAVVWASFMIQPSM